MGVWIETIGLPGAGKSTFFKKYARALEEKYQIIDSHHATLPQRFYAKAIYFSKTRSQTNDRNYALKLAYRVSFRTGVSQGKDIYFEDSGLSQPFLENMIETDFTDADEKLALLKKMPLSDVLLYFRTTPQTALAREMGRTPRRFILAESDLNIRYQNAITLLDEILPSLSQTVITVTDENQNDIVKGLL